MLTGEVLRELRSEPGRSALAEAAAQDPRPEDYLSLTQQLGRRFPPPLARAAAQQAILRRRAKAKFDAADGMFFTPQGLEQATHGAVAEYRAGRFGAWPLVFDLGCGIGGDSLALAAHSPVLAIDLQACALRALAASADHLKPPHPIDVCQADLRDLPWRFPPGRAAFFDPARRSSRGRIRHPMDYQPPLGFIERWIHHLAGLGAKVSPAVDLRHLSGFDCEVEFISYAGDLKEAALWFGALKTVDRRATVLPAGASMTGGDRRGRPLSAPGVYVYEPDPAVMRAGLIGELGEQLEACQLDPRLAFLTSDRWLPSPFAKAYHVLDSFPFNLKRLKAYLRQRRLGRLTLKKRGSPLEVEAIARRLKVPGEEHATLIFTRAGGRHSVLVVEPLGDSGPSPVRPGS
jgi:hypothetical protein